MRRSHQPFASAPSNLSHETYPRALTALWLNRLLTRNIAFSDEVLEGIGWALPHMGSVLQEALAQCATLNMSVRAQDELKELRERCDSPPRLQDFLRIGPPAAQRLLRLALSGALARVPLRPSKDFRAARQILMDFFSLSPLACDVCDLLFCVYSFGQIEAVFEDHLDIKRSNGWKLLT